MSTAIVEIGDVIKPTLATTDAKKEVHIKWSQGHKEKEADYYRGTYTNETKSIRPRFEVDGCLPLTRPLNSWEERHHLHPEKQVGCVPERIEQ
jgi:hypothetical protein